MKKAYKVNVLILILACMILVLFRPETQGLKKPGGDKKSSEKIPENEEMWYSIESGTREIKGSLKILDWGIVDTPNFGGYVWRGWSVKFSFVPRQGATHIYFFVNHRALHCGDRITKIVVNVNDKVIDFPQPPDIRDVYEEADITDYCLPGKENTIQYSITNECRFGLQKFGVKWKN